MAGSMGSTFTFFLGWRKFSKTDVDPKFFVGATFFAAGVGPALFSFAFGVLCIAAVGTVDNESADFLLFDIGAGFFTPTAPTPNAVEAISGVLGGDSAFFLFLETGFVVLSASPKSSVLA